jgi:hypothetical protein
LGWAPRHFGAALDLNPLACEVPQYSSRAMTNVDERLVRAKARLDRLETFPDPVRVEGIRVRLTPWFFRLPRLRRYKGYALRRTILVRSAHPSDDLLTHELCHIWQMQQRPVAAMLAWLRYGYRENPFELEARSAVERTRTPRADPDAL